MPNRFKKIVAAVDTRVKCAANQNTVTSNNVTSLLDARQLIDYLNDAINAYWRSRKPHQHKTPLFREFTEEACKKVLKAAETTEDPIYVIQNSLLNYNIHLLADREFSDYINAGIYLYHCQKLKEKSERPTVLPSEIMTAYHALASRHLPITPADKALYQAARASDAEIDIRTQNISADFKAQIAKARLTESNAREYKVKNIFTLADFILYGMNDYLNERLDKVTAARKQQIEELKNTLPQFNNDKALISYLHDYFRSPAFKKTTGFWCSRLEKHCLDAIRHFLQMQKELPVETSDQAAKHLKRHKIVHQWLPENAPTSGRKVFLAIHGLDDSVSTWEGIAPDLTRAGFEVLSYDQAGFGFDELRKKHHALDLKQMKYDFYVELKKLAQDPSVSEIHLLGHSAGGALLSNTMATIHNCKKEYGKIKSVTCISPAVMSNPVYDLISEIPDRIFGIPGDMSESTYFARKEGLSRIGGQGIKGSVLNFVDLVARGFTNLRKLISGIYQPNDHDTQPLQWHIFADRKDKVIPVHNFKQLRLGLFDQQSQVASPHRSVTVDILSSVGHHMHGMFSSVEKVLAHKILDYIHAPEPQLKKVI